MSLKNKSKSGNINTYLLGLLALTSRHMCEAGRSMEAEADMLAEELMKEAVDLRALDHIKGILDLVNILELDKERGKLIGDYLNLLYTKQIGYETFIRDLNGTSN